MSAKKKLRRLERLLEEEQANARAWRTAAAQVAEALREERQRSRALEEAANTSTGREPAAPTVIK